MMRKFVNSGILALLVCLITNIPVFADVNLPKVTVAGQEFYVYELKKGDSLYGISNRFGWNVDRLMEINPSLVRKLSKGSKVYFPVDDEIADNYEAPVDFSSDSYPVIQHVVKKGDSVYSIAKMYDVPVDKIYLYNPDTKYRLKRGSVVTIPQEPKDINDGSRFLFYAIRPGDSLNSIADTYNTSVEQIMRDNKGVSHSNFEAGDLLRLSVNSKRNDIVTQTVDETRLAHVDSYKAEKDDTWESVARKTNSDAEQLREMNEGTELKKNARIDVPVFATTHAERDVVAEDERENSPEGMIDIYNDVHNIVRDDSASAASVSVAVLIEDPQSKRDNEFVRGALLAIDRLKNSPYQIRFKLLQDRTAAADSLHAVKALLDSLKSFSPDLVVTTCEKNFPNWLAEYGEDNGVEIVNSFDVKSELYMQNPAVIHLLTPSSYFSEAVAEWFSSTFPDHKLLAAGKKDADDAYAEAILARVSEAPASVDAETLAEMKLDDFGRYLIYCYPTSKDEVTAILNAVASLKEANPLASVKVMGRPNWITFADDHKSLFASADIYFPSRFFFDHNSPDARKFIADYTSYFGHGPIKAFPTYAASGFDIMSYFIENLASNEGDFNASVGEKEELQTPINLQRMGNWGGFFNPSAYVIHYQPYGDVEKILIKK